jgi:FolB domain-containing protein
MYPDSIKLPALPLKACLPDYVWSQNKKELKLQTLIVSLEVHANLSKAGKSDDLNASISYSDLTKLAQKLVQEDRKFEGGIRQVASELLQAVEAHASPVFDRTFASAVTVEQQKSLFQADHVAVSMSRPALQPRRGTETFSIRNFRVDSLIGVNDYERKARQPLFIDFEAELVPSADWEPHIVAQLIEEVRIQSLLALYLNLSTAQLDLPAFIDRNLPGRIGWEMPRKATYSRCQACHLQAICYQVCWSTSRVDP